MSDAESYESHRVDSRLDDHRHQPQSLRIPQPIPQVLPQRLRRGSRLHSFSELDPKDQRHLHVSASIKKRRNDNLEADLASPMMKYKTNDTHNSKEAKERRPSNSSIDSEANSHGSRSSQETEEDVCFPMLREHVRVNGIDFDEIDEFINEERDAQAALKEQQQLINNRFNNTSSSSQSRHQSSALLKYTPKNILQRPLDETSEETTEKDEFVTFSGARFEPAALPDRFSFFSSSIEETIHAPDIPSLTDLPAQSIREVFNDGKGTWWLDCSCPTDAEMKVISKAFGLHPLTSEDIRVQESREKVELFKNYYFVSFHTFEPDKESEDYLEPINMYIVVFRDGILTFHFSPVDHPPNVRRRVRQLRDYVDVSADWICYAIIDDITDGFIPVITGIEYEADAIEDSVFVARETDFGLMLQRIGESRRKVMTLMRLLSGKADVIKMFAKRCQDEASLVTRIHSQTNLNEPPLGFSHDGTGGISFGPKPGAPANMMASNQYQFQHPGSITQPRADIALYLGDIQDHVVTMFQNLLAYEKIFSRSHSNYLAQLQVQSVNSNNKVTVMLSQVTMLGTLLVPLNLVTGLFGMNVLVPGQDTTSLGWFFGILGVIVLVIAVLTFVARIYLARLLGAEQPITATGSTRRSLRSFGLKKNGPAKSIASFPGYSQS